MKEKTFQATIKINFVYTMEAKNKQDAISYVIDNVYDDFGINIKKDDIVKLEVLK
tara:strand:+ start:95 stop:259 length:165 start_codon:yes stop_codon:yes gene_type:complete